MSPGLERFSQLKDPQLPLTSRRESAFEAETWNISPTTENLETIMVVRMEKPTKASELEGVISAPLKPPES